MKPSRTWIFGVVAALLMTTALFGGLNAYLTHIQSSAPREIFELERVTVTAQPVQQPPAIAGTQSRQPASL